MNTNVSTSGPRCVRTALHCAYLGALLYAAAFTVAFFAVYFRVLMIVEYDPTSTVSGVLFVLFAVLPPLALIGAGSAFRLYRNAVGNVRRAGGSSILTALLFLLGLVLCLIIGCGLSVVGYVLAPMLAGSWLYLWYLRRRMIREAWFTIWALILAACPVVSIDQTGEAAVGLLACTLALLLAVDALVLYTVCRWRTGGNLASSPNYTFQFSLGSLLATTFGIAAYISALVLLARQL